MNKILRAAGFFLLIAVLICALAACGQRTAAAPEPEETKEITVETPPPSPTPMPTPTPSVPAVEVTTVPMPMPSVSPTPGVTTTDAGTATASPEVSPIVSARPTVSPSATAAAAPVYSADAAFASTILPDAALVPDSAVPGYVTGNNVAFRAGPSASARVIGTLESGTYIDIVGTENGWTEVIIRGVYGYISSEYVARGNYSVPSSGFVGSSGSTVIIVPGGEPVGGVVVEDRNDTNFIGSLPD